MKKRIIPCRNSNIRSKDLILTSFIALSFVIFTFVFLFNISYCQNDTNLEINVSNSEEQIFIGKYEGGIGTLGMKIEEKYYNWTATDWKNITCQYNQTFNNFVYKLNRLEIRTFNIRADSGDYDIANNISEMLVIDTEGYHAQEFTAPPSVDDLIAIDTLSLYLNHNILPGDYDDYYYSYVIFLSDENLTETLGYVFENVESRTVDEWIQVKMGSNILESGKKYNIEFFMLLEHKITGDLYYDPLERRLKTLRVKFKDNPKGMEMVEEAELEIDMFRKYSSWYGSVFYVMQK